MSLPKPKEVISVIYFFIVGFASFVMRKCSLQIRKIIHETIDGSTVGRSKFPQVLTVISGENRALELCFF